MPILNILTNVPGDRVSASETIAVLSKTMTTSIGKPEGYVLVTLQTDRAMCFGGTEEPCAYADVVSIGGFGGKTKEISAAIAAMVEKHLGVDSSRFYINFQAAEGSNIGWKGSTF